MEICVQVVPRASRNAVEALPGEALKIWVTAPPIKGQANRAVVDLLARYFKVKRSGVKLISGFSSRNKVFKVDIEK